MLTRAAEAWDFEAYEAQSSTTHDSPLGTSSWLVISKEIDIINSKREVSQQPIHPPSPSRGRIKVGCEGSAIDSDNEDP